MFFNATRFAGAFVLPWNLSMQIGVSTATTAAWDRFSVIASALLPVTQPPQVKPTIASAAAPAAAPHSEYVHFSSMIRPSLIASGSAHVMGARDSCYCQGSESTYLT
jgi:hypothetical protein